MKKEVEDFLRNELVYLCKETKDPEGKAYAFVLTITAADEKFSERFLREILDNCKPYLSEDHLSLYMGSFIGMNLLRISCDCNDFLQCLFMKFISHRGFALGQRFFLEKTVEYKDAKNKVENLQLELMHL